MPRPKGSLNKVRKDSVPIRTDIDREVAAMIDAHQSSNGIDTRTAAIEDIVRRYMARSRKKA